MKKFFTFIMIVASFSIQGCVAQYQQYSQTNGMILFNSGGYNTKKLQEGRYLVEFQAAPSTPHESIINYILYRSATLTTEQGYDGYVLESQVHYLSPPMQGYKTHMGTIIRLVKGPLGDEVINARLQEEKLRKFIK